MRQEAGGRRGEARPPRDDNFILATHCYGANMAGGVAGAEPPHKGGPNRPDRPELQWSVFSERTDWWVIGFRRSEEEENCARLVRRLAPN